MQNLLQPSHDSTFVSLNVDNRIFDWDPKFYLYRRPAMKLKLTEIC